MRWLVRVRDYDSPANRQSANSDTHSRSRDAMRPSFASMPSQEREGAGKAGCALHPRSRVQTCTKTRTRAYRFSGEHPAFPAQGREQVQKVSIIQRDAVGVSTVVSRSAAAIISCEKFCGTPRSQETSCARGGTIPIRPDNRREANALDWPLGVKSDIADALLNRFICGVEPGRYRHLQRLRDL